MCAKNQVQHRFMPFLNTQHAVRFMRSNLNKFRPGPFSKSATPEVKSFAGLLARSSHRTAVAAKWIFRLRESFIPRTDPNRTPNKEGRKREGRKETERNTCLQGWREGGGRGEDLAARGVVTGLNGGCKGSLGWKNSSFLRCWEMEMVRTTAQDLTQNSTSISAHQKLKPSLTGPHSQHLCIVRIVSSGVACALKIGNAN